MKDWFDALESREKLFVSSGGVVVLLAVLYAFAWIPFDKRHSELKDDVTTWKQSLVELRPLRQTTEQRSPSLSASTPSNAQSPIIVVDQTLRSRGLDRYRRRSQPTTSNGVRVEFENVAFDDLVLWLGDLSQQHAMHVQAGSFSSSNQASPGRINASLTLERAL